MCTPIFLRHGAEFIYFDMDVKALEGTPQKDNAVIKFDSEEALYDWYNDPEYQQWRALRLRSTTNATLLIAKEFVPPA
jgi:uncharacterized protein (DUF1330 family)